MKKIVSLLLCFVMMMSFTLSVSAVDLKSNFENSNDMSSSEYCENVIRQTFGPSSEQALQFTLQDSVQDSVENIIDFENSFYLYSFDEKPIAIFYQFKPIGFAVYDFRKGYVKEHNLEINHPFCTDPEKRYYYDGDCGYYEKTDEGFRHLAVGTLKPLGGSTSFGFKILKVFVIAVALIVVILVLRKKRSC